MADIPHIVCLGGGYVAIKLAQALRKAVKKKKVKLTVIDRHNYQTFHGLVGEMLFGKLQPGQINSASRRLFVPGHFHNADILSVDVEKQEIVTTRKFDGREYRLNYDHLVIALGSVDDLSRYPGISEHAFKLKKYHDVMSLRSHIFTMLELADIEPDEEERKRLLNFVIAGGNYAGVEVAAELSEFLPDMLKEKFPNISINDVTISMVHSGDQLLPELSLNYPRLAKYGNNFMASRNRMEIHYNTRVQSATPVEVLLSNGERISTRTLVSCVGTSANPILDQIPYERDTRGRVVTNKFCQVLGTTNVWAGGDCSAVPLPKGDEGATCPPLAIWAQTHGTKIGKNILRFTDGKELEPYKFSGLGDAVSFGHRKAAGHLKGIQVTGLPAWLTWRVFMFLYLPTWDRRIRAVFDWIIWPFIGRDIAFVQEDMGLNLGEALYEPGQVIVKEGEVGNTMFIVRSGTVEITKKQGEEEVLVGTLEEGSHFGEIAIFEGTKRTATVTAKTRVKVLTLREEMAAMLSGSLSDFNDMVHNREYDSKSRENS